MKFSAPIPIFRSFDEAKTKEFYVDFLGFKLDWEHRFEENTPLYMQVSLGECLLHISEHFGDSVPGSTIRVDVDDVATYNQELLAKKYKHARPGVQETEWGTREMVIRDPSGNKVVFSQRVK